MKFINNKFYKNPPQWLQINIMLDKIQELIASENISYWYDYDSIVKKNVKYYSASLFASRQCKEIAVIRVKSSKRLVIRK